MTGIEHRVLPIRLEGAARPVPLLAAFTYRCERPYELTLDFRGGGRSCVVSARAKDVRALCRRLVELVPRGEEQQHYDLDAGLSGLLSR